MRLIWCSRMHREERVGGPMRRSVVINVGIALCQAHAPLLARSHQVENLQKSHSDFCFSPDVFSEKKRFASLSEADLP